MSNMEIHSKYQGLIDDYNILKDELANLIEQKDYLLNHKKNRLEAEYINKIGRYEYEFFQIEIQILWTVRKTQMIQAKINRQEKIDEEKIDDELEKEYKVYMDELNNMAESIKFAEEIINLKTLSMDESREIKKLYIEIAKKLHPDLNPDMTEKQKVLWQRSKEAYEMGDLELLKIFHEMALDNSTIDSMNSMEELNQKINFFKNEILSISLKITYIQEEFPFSEEEFLKDVKRVEEKQRNLLKKIKIAKLALEKSKEELLIIMPTENNYLN